MRRILFLTAAAAIAGAVAQVALAQEETPKRPDAAQLFSRLDKNADGVLTADEVGDEHKEYFERLLRTGDKNKDGKLSKEEFVAALAGGEKKRPEGEGEKRPLPKDFDPEAFFNRLDRNGDGKISKDEIPEGAREYLQRLDANKDGEITKEEFKAGAAKLRPGEAAPRPTSPGGGDGALFRALDTNGDGRISAEEMSRAPEALKKLDRNGDGFITREELGGPAPGTPAPSGVGANFVLERIKQLDKNGDGKLSKDEAPERLQENFDRFDTNKDGFLDADELRRVFEGAKEKFKAKKERPKDKEKPKDKE